MHADGLTLYKLIVLYMLDKVDFPLTNSQLSQFILDKGYTNYFNLQQAINELVDSSLIRPEIIRNTSHYHSTPAGVETLRLFEYKIPDAIKADIMEYFEENRYQLRNEVEILSEYYPAKKGEYTVNCIVKEKSSTLLEVKLNVVSEEQAVAICDNWKSNSSDVYTYLIHTLMFKKKETETMD